MLALIAATELETRLLSSQLNAAEPLPGGFPLFKGRLQEKDVLLTHSGIGKSNAAAAATSLLCSFQPEALINIGCGGAFIGSGLQPGDLALASEDVFADEGSNSPEGFLDMEALKLPLRENKEGAIFNRLPGNAPLLSMARQPLEDFAARGAVKFAMGPFVTVSTCTGTDRQGEERQLRTGGICESMEGAAIALVAARFEVPFLQLRGISNLAADRDRAAWDLPGACRIAQSSLLDLFTHWPGEA